MTLAEIDQILPRISVTAGFQHWGVSFSQERISEAEQRWSPFISIINMSVHVQSRGEIAPTPKHLTPRNFMRRNDIEQVTEEYILLMCCRMFRLFVEHETREAFCVDGKIHYDPHKHSCVTNLNLFELDGCPDCEKRFNVQSRPPTLSELRYDPGQLHST